MTTPVFACGAEGASENNYASGHWTTAAGTFSQDTTHVRSGSYAWKFSPYNGIYLGRDLSGSQHLVGRLAVYLEQAPTSTSRLFDFNAATQWRSAEIASNGYVYFGQRDAEGYTGGVASTLPFPIGEWVVIDFHVNASANPNTHDWSINGVPQTQHTDAYAAGNVTSFDLIGNVCDKATWIDDLVLSGTAADYPIPDGYVNASDAWVTLPGITGITMARGGLV